LFTKVICPHNEKKAKTFHIYPFNISNTVEGEAIIISTLKYVG